MSIEVLLELDDGDFSLTKEERNNIVFYSVAIEGYIGLETLQGFVYLYETYLDKLHDYLVESQYEKIETADWDTIYRKRAIEICHTSDYYWVFLDDYTSTNPWDIHEYLEDVIEQIKSQQ